MLTIDATNHGSRECPEFHPQECMQCGVCVASCAHKALATVRRGAKFAIAVDADKCVGCGLCSRVCPAGFVPADRVNFDAISDSNAFLSFASDKAVSYAASSGGTIRALATRFAARPNSFVYSLRKSPDGPIPDILDATTVSEMPNSIYAPTMWGQNLNKARRLGAADRLLIIGLPCQIKGARKLLAAVRCKVFTIAIICRKTKDFRFADYVKRYHHLANGEPWVFRGYGWPGIIGNPDGAHSDYSQFSAIPFGLDIWNVSACSRCADCLATDVADLSVGDPWGIDRANRNGCNFLLTNTPAGEDLLAEAADDITLEPLSADEALAVIDRNAVNRKVDRLRYYTGLDKRFKTVLKYKALQLKSALAGSFVTAVGHTRPGAAACRLLLAFDKRIKNLLR